jgi:hypothetical protein
MKLIVSLLVVLALTGCTKVRGPSGWSYSSGLFNKTFKRLTFSTNTNGVSTLEVEGYASDATALVEAAAEGVAKGLAKGIKP